MIVDSHQHFWDLDEVEYPWLVPEYGPIYRTFTPDELEPQLAAAGVDRTVLVQAANSYEDTDSMLRHAEAHEWIGAVVGWVPLEDARPRPRGSSMSVIWQNPWFKGVRHLNHEEADPDWLVRPAVIDGLKVLQERGLSTTSSPYIRCTSAMSRHWRAPARTSPSSSTTWPSRPSSAVTTTPGRPTCGPRPSTPTSTPRSRASTRPPTGQTWTAADLVRSRSASRWRSSVPKRLLFGSDWPVAILAGDYAKVWSRDERASSTAWGSAASDRAAILGGNAASLYSIGAAS